MGFSISSVGTVSGSLSTGSSTSLGTSSSSVSAPGSSSALGAGFGANLIGSFDTEGAANLEEAAGLVTAGFDEALGFRRGPGLAVAAFNGVPA